MDFFHHNLHFTGVDPNIKGFQEAIFSVASLEKSVKFYHQVCGWEIISRNSGDSELKKLWQLDKEVQIEEAVLRNPSTKEGFLRLVKFSNVAQRQIRSGAQTWDSGGIFDVNIRASNMDTLYRTFQDEGWNGYSDPLRYTFDIYEVSEVLMRGHDGITLAIMQRFSPPLKKFPHLNITSRFFNSSIVCEDINTSYDFFANKLGFKLFFETKGDQRPNGKNVLGIPPNVNASVEVPIYIFRPDVNNFGSIELLELKQFKGKNCASLAKPPNLGILMLRFPVKDAKAYADLLEKRGVELNSPIQIMDIKPYGKMKIFSVRTPDGVWLEFMELIKN